MQISKTDYFTKSKVDRNFNNLAFQGRTTNSIKKSVSDFYRRFGTWLLGAGATAGAASVLMDNDNKDEELDNILKNLYPNMTSEENFVVKAAVRKNIELTKYFLTALNNEENSLRFGIEILSNKEIWDVESGFVKKIAEWKTHEDKYRFESGKDVIKILKCYKSNPERTLELLEEKHPKPYENLYVNSHSDFIEATLKAEELNKDLALKFENMRTPNGVKRFHGEQVLVLTQGYKLFSKSIDKILSASWDDGTPLFNNISGNFESFMKLVGAFEKCPNIVDFIKDSPGQFDRFNEAIESFSNAYEKDSDYAQKLLKMENKDGKRLYYAFEIESLVDAHLLDPSLTEELINITNNKERYLLDGEDILKFVKLHQTNPELFKILYESRDSQGNMRNFNDDFLKNASAIIEKNNNLFKDLLNKKNQDGTFSYHLNEILEIMSSFDKPESKKDFDYLLNLKRFNGDKKLNVHQVKLVLNVLEKNPKYREDLKKLISKPSITADVLVDMGFLLKEDEAYFSKALEKIEKISNYFEERKITPFNYSCDNFKGDISVTLDFNETKTFKFDENGELKSGKELEDAEETLYENKNISYKNGKIENSMDFMNYYERNETGLYPMEYVKEVIVPDSKVQYTTYTEKSKDYPNKLNLYTENDERKKALAETKKDSNGDIISTKDLGYKDTKLIQNYRENSNLRENAIKIIDKQGNIYLDSNIQFKKLDESHYESIENGIKYSIEYLSDKVVVTKAGEDPIELSIGDNDVNTPGVLSRDLLYLIKKLPGSALYNIHKYGILKIWQNENKIVDNNAHFNGFVNKIELSKYQSTDEKLFVLLHELGHSLDYHKLRLNKELVDIFKKEKESFYKVSTDLEQEALKYLIESGPITIGSISCEAIAETYAILHSLNQSPELELRGLMFQQYFQKTFAKIAELLLK